MRKNKRLVFISAVIFITGLLLVSYTGKKIRKLYVVPILMYHSVCPSPAKGDLLAVSCDIFEKQMKFLKDRRYNVMPLEKVAGLVKEKSSIPAKTVALTFDDGYKDNYKYAFPILKKYNLPAMVFVIINEIGRPGDDRLNWEEIKEMQSSGLITFGSHCLGPEPLTKINSQAVIKNEIFGSKKILEEKLGTRINAFSYPEGRFNDIIKQLVIDAGYSLAVATKPGKKFANDDVFALKRLRISSNAGNLFVFWVETSGYYNFMRENKRK